MKYLFPIIVFFIIGTVPLRAQEKPLMGGIELSDHDRSDIKTIIILLNEAEGVAFFSLEENTIYYTYEDEASRIAAMHSLSTRSFTIVQTNGLPTDFPLMPPNASEEDQNNYATQKSEWIEANPQRYENVQQQHHTISISQQEFDQLPEAKQQYILNHPDLYIIEP